MRILDSGSKGAARERVRPSLEAASEERTYELALLWRLVPYARRHWRLFVVALGLVPIVSMASIVQPLLLRDAIDAAVVERNAAGLGHATGLFGLAIGIEFLARFVQMLALQLGGQRTIADLRRATYAKVQRLSLAYLDRTPVGRVVTRVTHDTDAIGELFASGAILALSDIVMLVGIVAFMLWLDAWLSLAVFCALPPLLFAVNAIRERLRRAFREVRSTIALLNAYIAEQVQGIAIIQALGREADCFQEYREINAAHRDANYRAIRYDALLYSIVESMAAITMACVLWYASVRAKLLPAAYVGTVVAFYDAIQRFFVPIRDLSQKYTVVQASLAAAERLFALLDLRDEDAPSGLAVPVADPPPPRVVLALRGVHFAYRDGQPVLRGVDLDVERGSRVAIVGTSGAGKTTITALFLRLYDVTAGQVLVEGRDVRSMSREALRSRFSVVPQDAVLFAGTILENVTAFAPQPDRQRAIDALRRVGVWDLVERRGGLEARLESRASNFSAGEKQLLALARALYLDRPYLILDEATAHVDSETEARLQQAIAELLRGRTAIVIAHRLSTIRNADRIIVMHRGRVAEAGTHEELLARGGLYARLDRMQSLGTDGEVTSHAE